MNNTKKALQDWCSKNNLSLWDLLSLTLIPSRTIDNACYNGIRSLGVFNRVYLLTGLEEFKLTEKEQQNITKRAADKKSDEYWNFKIASKFINDWKRDGTLPDPELRLVVNKETKRSKEDIVLLYREKYSNIDHIPTSSSKKEPVVSSDTENSIDVLLENLRNAVNLPNSKLTEFIQANKQSLREISSNVNLLLHDDPIWAIKTFKQTETKFEKTTKTN